MTEERKDQRILTIIQFLGMVVVGLVDGDICYKPRVLGQAPNGGYVFQPMLGNPEEMWIGTFQLAYQPAPDDPIRARYWEAVSGITLAKRIPESVKIQPTN